MTAIDVAEMTGWTRALQQRQRGWMQRATVSTAAAIIFSPVLGFEQTLPWLIAFVIAQGLEHLALSAAAKGREVTSGRMAMGMAALFLSGASFGALSIPLWLTGGVMGGLCATALLCGGALYSTLHSVGSMRALLATAGPQYLYLCLGAWFMTRVGAPAPFVVATLICGVTFSIYCLWTWRTMNDVYRSETAARLDSQQRREEAERRMGAQSAFLAAVGHDLRTPISAILTGAAELERDAEGSSDARARAKAALEQAPEFDRKTLDVSRWSCAACCARPPASGGRPWPARACACASTRAARRLNGSLATPCGCARSSTI